ncbi:MAG: TIGR00730 family Rossman fold protein [Rubricoccaceae bacterium]
MTEIRTVCVYCGSSRGDRLVYAEAARQLGAHLAHEGIGLVTGGGKVGLMGVIADAVLDAGGEAVGIIPQALLNREVGHTGLTELVVVDTMHQRKTLMAARADAVVALPGGLGTLEEITEMLTWAQLGIHAKPCGLFNVEGYYDALVAFFDHATAERFVRPAHRAMLTVASSPDEMLAGLRAHTPPTVSKWMDRDDV